MPKGLKKQNKEKTTLDNTLIKMEEKRQRDFIREVVHPYLLENSLNIKDAEEMLYICKTAVEAAFNKKILTYQIEVSAKPIPTLDYMEGLREVIIDTKDRERFVGLMKLFETERISTATTLIDGLKKAYEGFRAEEIHGRALSTLKTDFL